MDLAQARVDLFVVGRDFYVGSITTGLKNGWCEFEALGLAQVREHCGGSPQLGTVWYLAERVPPDALTAFEESRRQQLWLGAQGSGVARIIIDPSQPMRRVGELGAAGECSFRTETDAVRALQQGPLAHDALVISAGRHLPLLANFLNETYDGRKKLVLPPNATSSAAALDANDLEAARLNGPQHEAAWNTYERSKNHSTCVAEWLGILSAPDVPLPILRELRDLSFRKTANWLRQVRDDPSSDERVFDRARQAVQPMMLSIAAGAERFARRSRCIDYITRKLVAQAADALIAEHRPQTFDHAVRGWAAARAKRVYAALVRIGWSLKRQEGSHRTLQRLGWRDYVFTFHDSVEIGPPVLAEIGKATGLRPNDL